MKTNIIKILLAITIIFNISILSVNAEQTSPNTGTSEASTNQYDLKINSDNKGGGDNGITNDALNELSDGDDFIEPGDTGKMGAYNLILKIAQSLKNIFLVLATIYFLITVLKLLFSEGSSDEEFAKFKKGFIWITVGIIVMQIAYSYVATIYNKKIGSEIAGGLISNIVEPLIKLVETAAAFFFIGIMIFSFYKMVTAGGDEEKAKQGKMGVLHAFIGFVVIKLSYYIVSAVYSKTLCSVDGVSCTNEKDLTDGAQIIFTVINWLNGFVGLAVVLMIIYTGFQIIFSNGEDDKIKTAKKSIIYIIIGIVILIMNYFILTFFLTPELIK
ncbi:MAG: hypothetical protein Q9M94_00100 [Candidatus Gracilibacteria bacterium]|nr:hypothetical protein [Candidatus Gracilibacteria bacterium]MDQ7023410.1 hypothetical protein [Candidatus Gracilibacteria bacterium]